MKPLVNKIIKLTGISEEWLYTISILFLLIKDIIINYIYGYKSEIVIKWLEYYEILYEVNNFF